MFARSRWPVQTVKSLWKKAKQPTSVKAPHTFSAPPPVCLPSHTNLPPRRAAPCAKSKSDVEGDILYLGFTIIQCIWSSLKKSKVATTEFIESEGLKKKKKNLISSCHKHEWAQLLLCYLIHILWRCFPHKASVFVFQGHHKHEGYHCGPGRLQRVFPGVLQHWLLRRIWEQAKSSQIKPQNQMHRLRQAHGGQSV